MIEAKNNFNGGLNLDDSPYLIPNNSYIDALNITRDAIEGSNDKAITNIVGNLNVEYVYEYDCNVSITSKAESEVVIIDDYPVTIWFLKLTFSDNLFVPKDFKFSLYLSPLSNPENLALIAEYTTNSTTSVSQVIQNLYNSMVSIGLISAPTITVTDNTIRFRINESLYQKNCPSTIAYQGVETIFTNKCIGAYSDTLRNTIIYFIYSDTGFHRILEYNNSSRTISPIFINLTDSDGIDILGLTENNKINNINVYHRNIEEEEGDILYFIDSLGRPTVMDILRFKNKEYTPVSRSIIDVGKRPPLLPLKYSYGDDQNVGVNFLKDRLFRFKYRYIYDNNEKSTCSPISDVLLPKNSLDENYTNDPLKNNFITIQMDSGDKDVKSVELLVSYVNKTNDWSDFASVDTIDKSTLGLTQTNTIILDQEAVPQHYVLDILFNGSKGIGVGTNIKIYLFKISTGVNTVVAEYTTVLGDTATSIATSLASDCNAKGLIGVSATSSGESLSLVFYITWAFNEIVINKITDYLPVNYYFYNDGTYPIIDINESIQLFDYVPDKANAQEMPNGNVLLYGGITEGYDKNLIPNVLNEVDTKKSGSITFQQLNASCTWNAYYNSGDRYTSNFIRFSGIPSYGTIVKYWRYDGRSGGGVFVKGTYTTQQGDTLNDVCNGLLDNIRNQDDGTLNSYSIDTYYHEIGLYYNGNTNPRYAVHVDHIEIIQPLSSTNVLPSFLYSTKRRLGIAYFDEKGKTNGILYSGNIEFPDYNEKDGEMLLPFINTKIYHKPPEWAYSYGFYLTKESTQFLYWICTGLNSSSSDYWYFNISNLELNQQKFPGKTAVLSWGYQDGDRLRVLKDMTTGGITSYCEVPIVGFVKDPPGVGTGTYVKVAKTDALNTATSGSDHQFLVQIYRNIQQVSNAKNDVYYEFGQNYLIGNPTLPSRYHIGMVQNQGVPPTLRVTYNISGNSVDISFLGTILTGINVKVKYTNDDLASYTTSIGDEIEQIVNDLISDLSPFVGTYFASGGVIKLSATQIRLIMETGFSPNNISVPIIYPSPDLIPAEFNFYGGDVYFKSRIIYMDANTAKSYNCLDRNFADNYISSINNIDGRSSVIDINAKRAYYSTLVRFSNAYQANTNINATNRFYPNNFDEYDYSFGDIMRFKVRDRFIRVFQKNKVGQVPLYHQILKEQNKENLVVTDKLLNPIQYYVGDVGIGDNPESLASYNFADYFTSNKRGAICRVSNNGVDFISVMGKINSWTTQKLPSRTGNSKVYGVFDNRLANYIVALEGTPEDIPYTLCYDEELNTFDSFFSYYPEMMTCLNTLLVTFKFGQLWTHDSIYYNSFYNQNCESSLRVIFNQSPIDKKTFTSISHVASGVWECPDINTDLKTYGSKMTTNLGYSDFDYLEGSYEAAILGDANSPGGVACGDSMKGKYIEVKFQKYPASSLITLNSLSLKYINSPLNNR